MAKTFLPLASVAVVVIVGALIVLKGSIPLRSPSSTPTASIAASASPAPSPSPDPYAGWKSYSDTTFGFSFRYPAQWGDVTVAHKNGDTGTDFSGTFSSNALVTFAGQTPDYSAGIGAGFLSFSGCTRNMDASYACKFAQDKSRPISPSETIATADGNTALILFHQEISQVLAPTTRGAYVNLSGSAYPGIAFQYLQIPTTDESSFDNMIRSIKSL